MSNENAKGGLSVLVLSSSIKAIIHHTYEQEETIINPIKSLYSLNPLIANKSIHKNK